MYWRRKKNQDISGGFRYTVHVVEKKNERRWQDHCKSVAHSAEGQGPSMRFLSLLSCGLEYYWDGLFSKVSLLFGSNNIENNNNNNNSDNT